MKLWGELLTINNSDFRQLKKSAFLLESWSIPNQDQTISGYLNKKKNIICIKFYWLILKILTAYISNADLCLGSLFR